MKWKNLLFEYLDDDLNRKYASFIFKKLLQANKKKGKYIIKCKNKKLEVKENEIEEKEKEICEFIVEKALEEGYNAMVVPFIISFDQAPNFYLSIEKPKEEELWWWLYYIVTGLHFGEYIINISNVDKKILDKFREYLQKENFLIFRKEKMGLNVGEMFSKLNLPKVTLKEFIFGFLILAYFSKFLKEMKEMAKTSKELKEMGFDVDEITNINDDATLFIFILSRQKKKLYIFPKLKSLLLSWFDDPEKLSSFIFSFYITDRSYHDLSVTLLNKFLYYFLQNKVSGELLNKLVELKVFYELKRKGKIYGVRKSVFFFSKLSKI